MARDCDMFESVRVFECVLCSNGGLSMCVYVSGCVCGREAMCCVNCDKVT